MSLYPPLPAISHSAPSFLLPVQLLLRLLLQALDTLFRSLNFRTIRFHLSFITRPQNQHSIFPKRNTR